MSLMAVCARYGGIQPDVFAQMDYREAHELGKRVTELQAEEMKAYADLHVSLTKVLMQTLGASVRW